MYKIHAVTSPQASWVIGSFGVFFFLNGCSMTWLNTGHFFAFYFWLEMSYYDIIYINYKLLLKKIYLLIWIK